MAKKVLERFNEAEKRRQPELKANALGVKVVAHPAVDERVPETKNRRLRKRRRKKRQKHRQQ